MPNAECQIQMQAQAADISGRVLYVAENGNDNTGNGSSESPYRSIKKAADEATAGRTVLIRPGTYIEDDIRPKESGKADAMIIFRPENTSDKAHAAHLSCRIITSAFRQNGK